MKLLSGTGMLRAAAFLGLCATVSACTGYEGVRQPAYTSTMARPVPTDVYPVIEGRRPAATAQMSNDQAATVSASLTSLSARRSSGQISESEYQRRLKELRALAEHHGTDTLNEIRN